MDYTIHVRDAQRRTIVEVDDYQSFDAYARFNAVGSWSLDIDYGTAAAAALLEDRAGIIITGDNGFVMSGPAVKRTRIRSTSQSRLKVEGVDDNVWLERRLAYPAPLDVSASPHNVAEYDVRTGAAETVMRAYVDANAGPNALSPRRVDGLTLAADGGLGLDIIGRARFHNLLELIRGCALTGGDLGFRIAQISGALQFSVYQPTDRTSTAVFSIELGSLSDYSYEERIGGANYVIAGGAGEGTARTFVETGLSPAISADGRIEGFVDQRSTTDLAELEQAIDEHLAEGAAQTNLSLTPVDTQSMAFGTHWQLGDRVTVMVDDAPITDVVREVHLVLDQNGDQVLPTIGTPGAEQRPGGLRLFDQVRRLRNRIAHLERS